eukprot:TRINITY_DN69871_c0_g1_i1.p1 TRINITY_DN69871_c0_g1~~TRINITY_DN69871_c0_g1_i1.p1  ORF type:complete len:202 (-),score=27.23 TRINITY_DN69871_c0_g1_i1:159-764(-)
MAMYLAGPKGNHSRSLFYPSGPLTAKHTKAREGLHSNVESDLVWPKSGPPTHEHRVQRGEKAPPLLDAKHVSRLAGRAIVDVRRDINDMMRDKKGEGSIAGFLLTPAGYKQKMQKCREKELDDWSDDELWESVGQNASTTRQALRKQAIGKLVATRHLDSVPRSTASPPSTARSCSRNRDCGIDHPMPSANVPRGVCNTAR